jgi:multiple sugar transport system permease protein
MATERLTGIQDNVESRPVGRRWVPGRRLLAHFALIIVTLVMLYPLVWMVASSFKPTDEIFSQPGLIPRHFEPSNYA